MPQNDRETRVLSVQESLVSSSGRALRSARPISLQPGRIAAFQRLTRRGRPD